MSIEKLANKNFKTSWKILNELLGNLPTIDTLDIGNFKKVGMIFSTEEATCSKCGSDKGVHADIKVQADPENPDGRIVTIQIWCKKCDKTFGWGFRVEGYSEKKEK